MPALINGQSDYYARRQRRQTSNSQTSLPDQLRNSASQVASPSQSAVYLPATTYGQTQAHSRSSHSRTSSSSYGPLSGRPGGLIHGVIDSQIPVQLSNDPDPDQYYRIYQDPFESSMPVSLNLHQSAIRTTGLEDYPDNPMDRDGSLASVQITGEQGGLSSTNAGEFPRQDADRIPTAGPGLRSRKSSVRNLVAQINATSSEEIPPLPVYLPSGNNSRDISPVLAAGATFPQPNGGRNLSASSTSKQPADLSGALRESFGLGLSTTLPSHKSQPQNAQQRRPLFGELVPGLSSNQIAGYGIVGARRRSGSEGSPMHSPNPMFPQHDLTTKISYSMSPTAGTGRDIQMLAPTVYSGPHTISRPIHRRANSDFPATPSRTVQEMSITPPVRSSSRKKSSSVSRIPISTHRQGGTSDSEHGAAIEISPSMLEMLHTSPDPRLIGSSLPRPSGQISPRRRQQRSPTKITSPDRRGKQAALSRGQKSPSLRANIIAPPAKISPPLRSSKPRLPVSSASTAASRAKMAERFTAMQKLNHEKRLRQSKPLRPPELSDIDLKARRLKITQALSRSREGQDLRVDLSNLRRRDMSSSRTASPALSDASQSTGYKDIQTRVPSVFIESAEQYLADAVETPVDEEDADERLATQSALQAMQGTSPDLTNDHYLPASVDDAKRDYSKKPTRLSTQFLDTRRGLDPVSAFTDATAETEGTNIDPEPQSSLAEPRDYSQTLLNHVMEMRRRTPLSFPDDSPQSTGDFSDHGDEESVHLILRDTTFLDEDEAISKGYRPERIEQGSLIAQNNYPQARDSWTSSIHSEQEEQNEELEPHLSSRHSEMEGGEQDTERISKPSSRSRTHNAYTATFRSTMDSDAYTIVNIVLQQHSSSGVVDQQFVDEVYQRVVEHSPYIEAEGVVDTQQIERLCIQEIQQRDEEWRQSTMHEDAADRQESVPESTSAELDHLTLPSHEFRRHQTKSSLGSAQDWADASPSIGDWMQYADNQTPLNEGQDGLTTPVNDVFSHTELTATPRPHTHETRLQTPGTTAKILPISQDQTIYTAVDPEEYGVAIIRAPVDSPPPPPISKSPIVGSPKSDRMSVLHPSGLHSMPNIPNRSASLTSGMMAFSPEMRSPGVTGEPQLRPEETLSPEQRRLKQRRHVLKELVDTEFSYERDMRVLCDIYKQTAPAALTEEDIKILFGNIDQIQAFSRDFLTLLKHSAKPAYIMERPKKLNKDDNISGIIPHNSSSSTLASVKASEQELPDAQKDKGTRIGQAFEASMHDMEQVYNEYIRNRHAANQKLEAVQRSASACEWLKECRDNSSDITNAWNLDALLVKPVQRITKYPLLLKELIDSTVETHPDLVSLKGAFSSMTEVNIRINDVKKHAELVDQVLNRKRGQSDVRIGLSKAFGRRAEKLRQHVGMTEMYEDSEYNDIRISYDNNIVQLIVVGNDCQSYEKGLTYWVNKMCQIAAAAEAWVDVSHSHHPQLESKLRQLAMVIRGISTIALPDHFEHLQKKVVQPMQKTVDMLTKFKDEPKGLLNKRDKRLIDYAQMRTKKERGEKVDRKMTERMEQWEALNLEAKERMKKLLRATAHLVQSCQGNLIQLQMSWLTMVQQKFSVSMGIPIDRLDVQNVEKDWQLDFDFQEATALGLGICNGSLLLQATNMASFLTPSSTLNGEDSPRETSISSFTKRSISMNSDTSQTRFHDNLRTSSSTFGPSEYPERQNPHNVSNGRMRATSTTSGKHSKTPDSLNRTGVATKHSSTSANYSRPVTSPATQQEGFLQPRLSMGTDSALDGYFRNEVIRDRPPSGSTFFSAPSGPTQPMPSHLSASSSVFSSAMPMSDTPVKDHPATGHPEPEPNVLFIAVSVYEFNIDRSRREAGFPYLTYVTGEIFDVIGERGELWLAKNQDDPQKLVGWIWNKHFAKLAT